MWIKQLSSKVNGFASSPWLTSTNDRVSKPGHHRGKQVSQRNWIVGSINRSRKTIISLFTRMGEYKTNCFESNFVSAIPRNSFRNECGNSIENINKGNIDFLDCFHKRRRKWSFEIKVNQESWTMSNSAEATLTLLKFNLETVHTLQAHALKKRLGLLRSTQDF